MELLSLDGTRIELLRFSIIKVAKAGVLINLSYQYFLFFVLFVCLVSLGNLAFLFSFVGMQYFYSSVRS